MDKSRNRYINEAIDFYNKYHQRKMREQQFEKEAKLGEKDAMEVLKEFEEIDYED